MEFLLPAAWGAAALATHGKTRTVLAVIAVVSLGFTLYFRQVKAGKA